MEESWRFRWTEDRHRVYAPNLSLSTFFWILFKNTYLLLCALTFCLMRGRRRASDSSELEVQMVWAAMDKGWELNLSTRATKTLSCWVIFPALPSRFFLQENRKKMVVLLPLLFFPISLHFGLVCGPSESMGGHMRGKKMWNFSSKRPAASMRFSLDSDISCVVPESSEDTFERQMLTSCPRIRESNSVA